ncbi:MAG: ribosome-associated translation inhibitor RaiA [Mesorhizobium amorphae]|nr:MAG: ribosome-associated translation inhibitor RaiA [Mesorhizobium amorphae]
MNLRISGKHMDIGEAFRARIEQRLGEVVTKYFDGGVNGHITVSKSTVSRTGERFTADCTLHLDTGLTLQASGGAAEPGRAFDLMADRLEKRLRRYKRRLKAHPSGPSAEDAIDIAYRVVAPLAEDDEDDGEPLSEGPAIVAESSLALRTMSVASAVEELDAKEGPVFVFRNPQSGGVNIVYRRDDGNIGWIDPAATSAAAA